MTTSKTTVHPDPLGRSLCAPTRLSASTPSGTCCWRPPARLEARSGHRVALARGADGAAPHRHDKASELFFILSGELDVLARSGTGDVLLVLDDYHLVGSQPVHASLGFLLEHLPPGLHPVLASRADPPLALARLRARGQLTELRDAELRCTAGEAADVLRETACAELPDAAVTALVTRTEGWAAGLQLAALSLRGQADVAEFVAAFTGSHRYVLDYLATRSATRSPPGRCSGRPGSLSSTSIWSITSAARPRPSTGGCRSCPLRWSGPAPVVAGAGNHGRHQRPHRGRGTAPGRGGVRASRLGR